LTCARDLIARPHGWTKGVEKLTRTKNEPHYNEAKYAYCVMGAIRKCGRNTLDALAIAVTQECLPGQYQFNIPRFNDAKGTRQRSAVALLNRAIKKMERRVAQQQAA